VFCYQYNTVQICASSQGREGVETGRRASCRRDGRGVMAAHGQQGPCDTLTGRSALSTISWAPVCCECERGCGIEEVHRACK